MSHLLKSADSTGITNGLEQPAQVCQLGEVSWNIAEWAVLACNSASFHSDRG